METPSQKRAVKSGGLGGRGGPWSLWRILKPCNVAIAGPWLAPKKDFEYCRAT